MELERHVRNPERREYDVKGPKIGEVQNVQHAIVDAALPQLLSGSSDHGGRCIYREDLVTDLQEAARPIAGTAT